MRPRLSIRLTHPLIETLNSQPTNCLSHDSSLPTIGRDMEPTGIAQNNYICGKHVWTICALSFRLFGRIKMGIPWYSSRRHLQEPYNYSNTSTAQPWSLKSAWQSTHEKEAHMPSDPVQNSCKLDAITPSKYIWAIHLVVCKPLPPSHLIPTE
jgi:hypothetical protein